jgi:TRAP-type C4-dicarboxylate transport system substrate-binding protein
MMRQSRLVGRALALLLYAGVVAGYAVSAHAETLKASHQWPGGKGDVRDEMLQMIAREVAKADVGLEVKVYPGKSLYKPKEQWGAMVKGS